MFTYCYGQQCKTNVCSPIPMANTVKPMCFSLIHMAIDVKPLFLFRLFLWPTLYNYVCLSYSDGQRYTTILFCLLPWQTLYNQCVFVYCDGKRYKTNVVVAHCDCKRYTTYGFLFSPMANVVKTNLLFVYCDGNTYKISVFVPLSLWHTV